MSARRFFFAALTLAILAGGWFAYHRSAGSEDASTGSQEAAEDRQAEDAAATAAKARAAQAAAAKAASASAAEAAGASAKSEGAANAVPGLVKNLSAAVATRESREQAREDRRKKARAALDDFLRDELRMSDEQLQAYKDIQNNHDAQLKAARDADSDRTNQRAAMRAIRQDQTKELRDLVGDVDYARIQDFQRRQTEQFRDEHPDSWDGRRGRGR